jgi:O-antigen/teichoic acid export membrane protein
MLLLPSLIVSLLTELFKALKKPNESILASNILVNFFLIACLLIFREGNVERIIVFSFIARLLSIAVLIFKFNNLFYITGIHLLTFKELKVALFVNKKLCREYLNENFLLSFVAIANIMLGSLDALIIAAYLTAGDVALYTVANKVASFGSIILTTVNSLIGFQIAELSFHKDYKALANIFIKYTRIMFPLSLLYYAFSIGFAFMIPFIFGNDFESSINLCILLSFGQFISIITGPCSFFAIMTGETKKYMSITLQTAVISVISNLLFVYLWGIYGAVFSNFLALAYKNLYTFFFVKNRIHLQIRDFL